MPLQFPQLPQPQGPNPDGLANVMFKVAAEKRAREDQARRFMLDSTRMQHEQQRLDQQDRIAKVKDAMGFRTAMEGTLNKALPLLRTRPDQAHAMIAGWNQSIAGLPEEMQGNLRIQLPEQGAPVAPPPAEAPAQQTSLTPAIYTPDPNMPDRYEPDTRYRARPGTEEPGGPVSLLPEAPVAGPLEAGDQLLEGPNLALEMEMDRAEKAKLAAANEQAQRQYAQAREAYENPAYPIQIGQEKVTYHGREIEQAESQRKSEIAQQWAQNMLPAVGSDETAQKFVRITQAELAATGDLPKAAAAFNAFLAADAKGRQEMVKFAQQHANDKAKEDRAERNTRASEGRTQAALMQAGVKPTEVDLKIANEARQALNQYHIQKDYKGDIRQTRALVGLGKNLVTGGAALDTVSGARFANLVQERGILTDNDFKQFWKNIGGWESQAGEWFRQGMAGEIGPEKRATVLAAIRQLVENVSSDMQEMGKGAWEILSTPEHISQRAALMRAYYPDYAQPEGAPPEQIELERGGDGELRPKYKTQPAEVVRKAKGGGRRLPGPSDITNAAAGARRGGRPNPPKPKAHEAWEDF